MSHHPALEYERDLLTEPPGFVRAELDRNESRRKPGQQLPQHRFLRRDLVRIRKMLETTAAADPVMTTDHNGLSLTPVYTTRRLTKQRIPHNIFSICANCEIITRPE